MHVPSGDAELAAKLAAVMNTDRVEGLRRLSGGASRETYRFAADGRDYILQRQRPGDVRSMATEAQVVRAAHAAGVPTAEVIASGHEELGSSFMVLSAVQGETIARKILRDDEFADARAALPEQMAAALARLHALPVDLVDGLIENDQVTQYREALDSFGRPHPTFELAFRWLEAHRPAHAAKAIVHGDFRMGNLMIDQSGLAAVLDWELAHIGDPLEDLGWLCVKAWRFGSPRPVAGVGDYEPFLRAYEQASGRRIDADAVRWWEVLGTLKWGIMCILQSQSHLSGVVRSHELAAIGRRVCENEYDLFLALEGHW